MDTKKKSLTLVRETLRTLRISSHLKAGDGSSTPTGGGGNHPKPGGGSGGGGPGPHPQG